MPKSGLTALVFFLLFIMVDSCGYHRAAVNGGGTLPENIRTIAVVTFHNTSLKYRVEQRFTQAVMDEILRRARGVRVTSNPDDADAVITGDIRRFRPSGALLDPQGRTRLWQLTITTNVVLRDLHTHRILYQNPAVHFQGEYELSSNPETFFDEQNTAVDRIAKDFARSIVSTIMDGM
jgi:hypothetical protein